MSAGNRTVPRAAAGFTLVEMLISLTLVLLLTLALLTSYVFILRGEKSLVNYGEMNSQARKMLDTLGDDLRMARDVTNFTSTSLSLKLPTSVSDATATQTVTWDYVSATGKVTRTVGTTVTTLAKDVNSFSFYYTNNSNAVTTSLVEVKQVQLAMRMQRLVASAVTSEYVISAQFTMRSKKTSV